MPPYYTVCRGFLLISYLHFSWRISITQLLVRLIWWRIYLAIWLLFISNGTSKKKLQLMSPREKKKQVKGNRVQKTSKWKSFTCHEASGSWSLHSTMSCIKLCMHGVRVTGRCWKNICCYVSRILKKMRWRSSQIYANQAMLPCACIPSSGEQLLSVTASSPPSASSN